MGLVYHNEECPFQYFPSVRKNFFCSVVKFSVCYHRFWCRCLVIKLVVEFTNPKGQGFPNILLPEKHDFLFMGPTQSFLVMTVILEKATSSLRCTMEIFGWSAEAMTSRSPVQPKLVCSFIQQIHSQCNNAHSKKSLFLLCSVV